MEPFPCNDIAILYCQIEEPQLSLINDCKKVQQTYPIHKNVPLNNLSV